MPLFCAHCSAPHDNDAPWCDRCGADLGPGVGPVVAAPDPRRRHEVLVDGRRVNCVCFQEVPRFDPVSEIMDSVFRCMRSPERIDCVGCRICPRCGDLRCSCGSLAISIGVKVKGTVIETVPLVPRLV